MRFAQFMMTVAAGCLLLTSFSTAADQPQAEQVDNPIYKVWMKFNVGSSATLTGQFSADGMQMTSETTRKLTEKADDHVTLEVSTSMTMMGQQHQAPTRQMKVPAKINKPDIEQVGTEDVTAAGQTFHCKVYQINSLDAGASGGPQHAEKNAKAKVWVDEDVPGGLIKMEAKNEHGTVSMVLKSFNKT